MKTGSWLIISIIGSAVFAQTSGYTNKTQPRDIVTNEIDNGWQDDPYMEETKQTCNAGSISGCFASKTMSSMSGFFDRDLYTISKEARFVRTSPMSEKKISFEGMDFAQEPRSGESPWEAAIGFLARRAEHFIKTTALEVELNDEMTEHGKYQPRFIDEIYSEIERLEDKNEKPEKRYEIKKLFIPLLVILKIFKLKLLFLLPVLLGFVSFKKVIGILIFLVPGIIGYFKLCKPDINSSYGNFGHSNYYHRPPSIGEKYDQINTHMLSYREQQEAMKLAYHGYRN
ncbi:uncharacterized protein LOC106662084 [Cimex lectularius]|uniref:Osiris 2 n=1 Tax=Cimex lectularius TaxID=79782 RepID=A0A8I6RA53_CIMLE|nr:uncharacterized protein LOC106662084 [Cimex lectularius]